MSRSGVGSDGTDALVNDPSSPECVGQRNQSRHPIRTHDPWPPRQARTVPAASPHRHDPDRMGRGRPTATAPASTTTPTGQDAQGPWIWRGTGAFGSWHIVVRVDHGPQTLLPRRTRQDAAGLGSPPSPVHVDVGARGQPGRWVRARAAAPSSRCWRGSDVLAARAYAGPGTVLTPDVHLTSSPDVVAGKHDHRRRPWPRTYWLVTGRREASTAATSGATIPGAARPPYSWACRAMAGS